MSSTKLEDFRGKLEDGPIVETIEGPIGEPIVELNDRESIEGPVGETKDRLMG